MLHCDPHPPKIDYLFAVMPRSRTRPILRSYCACSPREEAAEHPRRDIPRNAARVHGRRSQTSRLAELVAARERDRVGDSKDQRNDCLRLVSPLV